MVLRLASLCGGVLVTPERGRSVRDTDEGKEESVRRTKGKSDRTVRESKEGK